MPFIADKTSSFVADKSSFEADDEQGFFDKAKSGLKSFANVASLVMPTLPQSTAGTPYGRGLLKGTAQIPADALNMIDAGVTALKAEPDAQSQQFDYFVATLPNMLNLTISKKIGGRIRRKFFEGTDLDERIQGWSRDKGKKIQKHLADNFPEESTKLGQWTQDLGTGTVSLAESIGLAIATRNPHVAGFAFGLKAGARGVVEAQELGKTDAEALHIGNLLGIAEGSLESVGIKYLTEATGGVVKRGIKSMASEFLQEFSQEAAGGFIRQAEGMREQSFEEAINILQESVYAGSLGAVLGGGTGVGFAIKQRRDITAQLIDLGVDPDIAKVGADEMLKQASSDVMSKVEELTSGKKIEGAIPRTEQELGEEVFKYDNAEDFAEGLIKEGKIAPESRKKAMAFYNEGEFHKTTSKVAEQDPSKFKTAKEFIDSKEMIKQDAPIEVRPSEYPSGKQGVSELETNPQNDKKAVIFRDNEGNPQGVLEFSVDEKGDLQPKESSVEVFVNPEYRRQGIATQLYDKAEALGYDLSKVKSQVFTKEGLALQEKRLTDVFNKAQGLDLREKLISQFKEGTKEQKEKQADDIIKQLGKSPTVKNVKISSLNFDREGRFFEDREESKKIIQEYRLKIRNGETLDPIIVNKDGEVLDGQHRAIAHFLESSFDRKGSKNVDVILPKLATEAKFDNLTTRKKALKIEQDEIAEDLKDTTPETLATDLQEIIKKAKEYDSAEQFTFDFAEGNFDHNYKYTTDSGYTGRFNHPKLEAHLKGTGMKTLTDIWNKAQETVEEPKSPTFNIHQEYYQDIALPETSKIRGIQKELQRLNGLRLSGKISAQEANKEAERLHKLLKQTALQEGIATRETKEGKTKLALREAGTFVPQEFANYTNFKDVQEFAGGWTDPTRALQNIDGALSVKQKKGLKDQSAPVEKYVLWRTRDISQQKMNWLDEKVVELQKVFGKTKPDTKADIAFTEQLRSGEPSALRDWYDSLLDEQNIMREMRGQEPIAFRDNYSPEILQDANIWDKVFSAFSTTEDVVKVLPDFVQPNKPFNPREMARKGAIPYEEQVQSAIHLAQKYLTTASRDIFNTSIIQNNKAFAQQLDSMGFEGSAKFIQDWTAEGFAGIAPQADRLIKLPPKASKVAKKFNNVRNLAVFPLNIGWMLGTQVLSINNTWARYGYVNSALGAIDYLKNTKNMNDYYSFKVKSSKNAQVSNQDAQNAIGGNVKVYTSPKEVFNNMTTILTNGMESFLTGSSIKAAERFGAKKGLRGKALQEYASDGGAKTQSMYNDEDKPRILRSLASKTLTPYQTFKLEMLNTAKEWAGKTGTPPDTKMEAMYMLIRYVIGLGLLREYSKKTSQRFFNAVETFLPWAEYWYTPLRKKLAGEYMGRTGQISPVSTGSEIIDGIKNVVEKRNWEKLNSAMIKYGPGIFGVGGGVQMERLWSTMRAYIDPDKAVRDRSGKMMFVVDNPKDLAVSSVWGKWATKGGQKYLDKRKPKTLQERWMYNNAKEIKKKTSPYPKTIQGMARKIEKDGKAMRKAWKNEDDSKVKKQLKETYMEFIKNSNKKLDDLRRTK